MKNDYNLRTIAAYNSSSQKYENSTAQMMLLPELEYFISLLPAHNMNILDAGCAFGRDTALFASKGLKPVGVDMSDKLLARANDLYPDIDFREMDVRQLEFEGGQFAGIWCSMVLLHLTDRDIKLALKEFMRVLDHDGVLYVSFKEGSGTKEFVEGFSANQSRFYNFKTIASCEALLKQCGFVIKKSYIFNEKERFGSDKRDLNIVNCFSIKK